MVEEEPSIRGHGFDPRMIRRNKGGSNVTKVNTDKLSKAQMGQFKNIQNDAVSGKISPAEAQRKIRKMLLLNKNVGGTYSKGADPLKLASPKKNRNSKAGIDGPSGEKRKRKAVRRPVRVANVDDFKEAPKLNKQKAGAEKMLKTVKKAVKRKDGGATDFGMLSVKAGIDNNPKPTQADRIAGATKNMRGGGIAIQGLGFKGVR